MPFNSGSSDGSHTCLRGHGHGHGHGNGHDDDDDEEDDEDDNDDEEDNDEDDKVTLVPARSCQQDKGSPSRASRRRSRRTLQTPPWRRQWWC